MNIQLQQLLIEAMATSIDDPLIDRPAENTLKVLAFVLIIAIALAIRIISNKVEYAIMFALICTLISVAFLVIK